MTAAIFLSLDLASKYFVFESLGYNETRTVIPGFLDFRRSLNDGAVFGSLTGYVGLFVAASLMAVAFVVYLFLAGGPRQCLMHYALGLILSGTLGNLYDRVFQVADIVTYRSRTGRELSVIGTVVNGSDGAEIRIGHWPDGAEPQVFQRSEVQVRRQGVVRDFLKFSTRFPSWVPRVGGYEIWPWIFNVADAALVCGVGLLLLGSWRDRRLAHAQGDGDHVPIAG